jgi:hypothetical protein
MPVIERACARFLKGTAQRLEGQAGWMPVPEEVIAECRRVSDDLHTREVLVRTNIRELLAEVDAAKALPATVEADTGGMVKRLSSGRRMP